MARGYLFTASEMRQRLYELQNDTSDTLIRDVMSAIRLETDNKYGTQIVWRATEGEAKHIDNIFTSLGYSITYRRKLVEENITYWDMIIKW